VVIDYSDRSPVERVSGQGLVPVIEDGGEVVADSRRILRYLEARHPDPPLFPADPARRAEMDVFLDWFDEVWKVPPNAIESELGAPQPDRERIAALSGRMAGWLDRFELLLTDREHLIGTDFSAADCVAFPFLKYARSREPADDELFHRILDEHQPLGDGHPRLAGWIDRVDARPRAY
jgi:glutathione S-transferase